MRTRLVRRLIGLMELMGGALLIFAAIGRARDGGASVAQIGGVGLLFSYAGVLMLSPGGSHRWSLIAQLAQLFALQTTSLGYLLYSPLGIYAGWLDGQFQLQIALGAELNLRVLRSESLGPGSFALNLVSLVMLLAIFGSVVKDPPSESTGRAQFG